jgi:hypothetical protein
LQGKANLLGTPL